MRLKKDSKNSIFYQDFGTKLREYPGNKDVNIVFAAARSFLDKTGGLCLASELEVMTNPAELNRKLVDFLIKKEEKFYEHNSRIKEVFHSFISHQMVYEALPEGMPHIAFYYPLHYWRLDSVNKVYAESESFRDLSLHWIPLTQIAQPEFHTTRLTQFDFQILCLGSQKVINQVFSPPTSGQGGLGQECSQVDHAVIICDDREYFKGMVEGILFGTYFDNGETWKFYRAYDLDLPTMSEIKNMKSLIIWASTQTPSLKDLADDITTYPSWIRPVTKMIKKVYHTFPQLKLLGIQLGSHLIAQALGGRVEKKEITDEAQRITHNSNRGLFCGKDPIKLEDSFFELAFVKSVPNLSKSLIKNNELTLYSVYEDSIQLILPKEGVVQGVSSRTGQISIWTMKDNNRVLGVQAHASFNTCLMHDLIVAKLYENGKIDDPIKNRFIEDLYDNEKKPIMRHTAIKIIRSFLKQKL